MPLYDQLLLLAHILFTLKPLNVCIKTRNGSFYQKGVFGFFSGFVYIKKGDSSILYIKNTLFLAVNRIH